MLRTRLCTFIQTASAPRAWHRGQRGAALAAVLTAIFILTVVAAATAIAAMGESRLSFDQYRGQQALAVAEAGAYRALAELRRRLSADLDTRIRQPSVSENEIRNICRSEDLAPPDPGLEMVMVLTGYAYPVAQGSTDWVQMSDTAVLRVGTSASRIQMTDAASSAVIGDFYATVAVRWSGRPALCQTGSTEPEQEIMWFDYALLSTGRAGNASRQVCLRSTFADRCPNWFPTVSPIWQGSYALTQGTTGGWPVLIERVASPGASPQSSHYVAVRWPSPAAVFADGDPLYDRPHWEETTGL